MVVVHWFHRDLVVLDSALKNGYLVVILDLSVGEPSKDIASGSKEKILLGKINNCLHVGR